MTLTTHAAIAAAVAKPFLTFNPVIAFFVGVASHYLSDAIPHWDYSLHSVDHEHKGKDHIVWHFGARSFVIDIARIASDALLGALLVYVIARPQSLHEALPLAAAIIGGILPDFLQGVYFTKKADFLKPLQKFHDTMHTKIKLGPYPAIGIPFQLAILLFSLWVL